MSSLEEDPEVLKTALEKFQKVYSLRLTGNLTEETIKKMSSPRCGKAPKLRTKYLTYKWSKSHITYKIKNWTAPFTESLLRDTFENYITQWTDNINLKITESTSNKADIEIYFSKQDGMKKTLGYAYFPEVGDIFFDQDEQWTEFWEDSDRIYFGWVAAHELGHALGLPHVNSESSIMNPYYTNTVTNPSISDLNKIKSLCVIKNREHYAVSKYWIISNNTAQNGPFPLKLDYEELPDKVDAAFSVKNVVYFFKNNKFFKFIRGKKDFVKKLISVGFEKLPNNIDAAFFDPSANYIYFFKGSKYYIFDIYEKIGKRLIAKNKISNDWPVPDNIEAATLWDNSRVLFIKNFMCYTVDLTTKELLSEQSCSNLYKC
ncbi:matrix metalloproteinase-14-like isoform X2 [Tribolium madens]|nr:matrix metalloproteinase-14-like isoform X2 [Tribolium madens]